tara:strand:+ start:26 stop:1432 length:1407 start_codon:yes stop_codon:yes gene_type:complete
MARLDAADRRGALKVMGKLFEELAAATNASGKNIKRENNEDKDKKYNLTNQYTRKESIRLKSGQDGLFNRFNELIVAGNLKQAFDLDLETTEGKVKFGSLTKPTEGANYGNVAEGVFAVALAARFSSGRVKRDTTAFDVYNLLRKISPSPMPGRTSVRAILNESAPNRDIPGRDKVICDITLAKVNMDFLRNPNNREALLEYVIASLAYANRQSVREWVETIYTNGRIDTVKIMADGVSNEKTSKIDVKVSITNKEQGQLKGVDINASIKADDVKQFGQVSGEDFRSVSGFFTTAIGNGLSSEALNFNSKSTGPAKMRHIYKAADTFIDNNLRLDSKGMAMKIGTGISRFATQDNAGVVDALSGDTVQLINLSKGEATIYNFKNVAQKLSEFRLISEYKTGGDNNLPTIVIREAESNKVVVQLRSRVENKIEKKTGRKYLYFRNYIEKGQFLTELIGTSALDNNATSS